MSGDGRIGQGASSLAISWENPVHKGFSHSAINGRRIPYRRVADIRVWRAHSMSEGGRSGQSASSLSTHLALPSASGPSLHLTPYTLHPTPHTLQLIHYTLHTTHYTPHTTHYTLHTTHSKIDGLAPHSNMSTFELTSGTTPPFILPLNAVPPCMDMVG